MKIALELLWFGSAVFLAGMCATKIEQNHFPDAAFYGLLSIGNFIEAGVKSHVRQVRESMERGK